MTHPNEALFDVFNLKALDIKQAERLNDTEIKYIFNFLQNHWNTDTRFDITMTSTLYACTSCQGYLVYLQRLAEKQGKLLNINFRANTEVENMWQARDLFD